MCISISKDKFYNIGDIIDIFIGNNKVGKLGVVNIVGYPESVTQELECKLVDYKKEHKVTFELFTNVNGYVRIMVRKN